MRGRSLFYMTRHIRALQLIQESNSSIVPDLNASEHQWDFDFGALLGQNNLGGETGLNAGGYFDFAQSFMPLPPGFHNQP